MTEFRSPHPNAAGIRGTQADHRPRHIHPRPASGIDSESVGLFHSFYQDAADGEEIIDALGLAEKRDTYYRMVEPAPSPEMRSLFRRLNQQRGRFRAQKPKTRRWATAPITESDRRRVRRGVDAQKTTAATMISPAASMTTPLRPHERTWASIGREGLPMYRNRAIALVDTIGAMDNPTPATIKTIPIRTTAERTHPYLRTERGAAVLLLVRDDLLPGIAAHG